MTDQADRYPLTTGPDGRVQLILALRGHPRTSAGDYARAQRYWACVPGGAQPRWLTGPAHDLRRAEDHAADVRAAAEAHAVAAAYLPGVSCAGCGDRQWKPRSRLSVTRYVLTGLTGGCLTCHDPATDTTAPPPPPPDLVPVQTVEARSLPAVTVRIDGPAAALLWSATGGDTETMSSLVTELISRNFGIRRPGA